MHWIRNQFFSYTSVFEWLKSLHFLRKYKENGLDYKKRKLPQIERQITNQLVNRNVNFVNNGSTDQRVSAHHWLLAGPWKNFISSRPMYLYIGVAHVIWNVLFVSLSPNRCQTLPWHHKDHTNSDSLKPPVQSSIMQHYTMFFC